MGEREKASSVRFRNHSNLVRSHQRPLETSKLHEAPIAHLLVHPWTLKLANTCQGPSSQGQTALQRFGVCRAQGLLVDKHGYASSCAPTHILRRKHVKASSFACFRLFMHVHILVLCSAVCSLFCLQSQRCVTAVGLEITQLRNVCSRAKPLPIPTELALTPAS